MNRPLQPMVLSKDIYLLMLRHIVLVLTLLACAFSNSHAQMRFEKLPLSISTPDRSEVLPVISSDGKTLYFSRVRIGLDSAPVFDIWMSHITGDTSFSEAEFLGGNLASSFGIAVTSVSPDNNTLYLIGNPKGDSPPEERLHITHRAAEGWSIPEAIHIPNLRVRGIFTDYSFGPDQKTLLMALDRDSSLGDRDLYVSFYDESKKSWSEPRWLGPTINSRFAEITPFLASDNKTLFFSSDRPGGIGEVDVYRSVRLDDTWRRWSVPENLGPSVNRAGRTSYYTEDAEGKYAYLTWKPAGGGQSDIYRVRVAHARAVALLHGVVTDATGKPISARIRYERLTDGKELGSARSNPTTGEYQLSLPAGEDYALHAEKNGYFPTSEHLDLRQLKAFEAIERNLKLSKIEAGAAIVLKNVFFETDKAALLPASFPELDRVKDLLTSQPTYKLQIAGHTDSTGSEAHNVELSKARAEAVQSYLLAKGIAPERLTAVSMGSTTPIATNTTEEGRAENRRVEFVLIANAERKNMGDVPK
jgi:outer membrane protein OmpA-like peptidoglycan-associated protein